MARGLESVLNIAVSCNLSTEYVRLIIGQKHDQSEHTCDEREMLRRKAERGIVLWLGLGIISLASIWLQRRRNQMQREHEWQVALLKNRRRLQSAIHSDDEIDLLHTATMDTNNVGGEAVSSGEDELAAIQLRRPVDTLFMKAVNLLRNTVFWLWISNFIASEVSDLYLESHTGTLVSISAASLSLQMILFPLI